ncbi:MAG: hypothetical protein GF309_12655 [Candidatus Lokiarchaeota archaeon]|nr:hypothetical protein [Candidatus Lokiarchaeota archaeon]
MPDGWEVAFSLDLFWPGDAGDDSDGDSLTNLQEYLNGTNPRTDDTDDDGLTDPGELNLGTDPSSNDTDGDGYIDGWEVAHGCDPLVIDQFCPAKPFLYLVIAASVIGALVLLLIGAEYICDGSFFS